MPKRTVGRFALPGLRGLAVVTVGTAASIFALKWFAPPPWRMPLSSHQAPLFPVGGMKTARASLLLSFPGGINSV